MNVIRHGHDAVGVPLVQAVHRFAYASPSCLIREGVTARRDANRNKINDLGFP